MRSLKTLSRGYMKKRGVVQIHISYFSTSRLNTPTKDDVSYLHHNCLKSRDGSILTRKDAVEKYNVGWMSQYQSPSKQNFVLKPKSANEISSILEYCEKQGIGVVTQAGNTGLVGGSIPTGNELILSTELLNEIENFDSLNGILTCGAGCILTDIQSYLQKQNHIPPIDIGSKGTCQIGGNIATNAGGSYYYRFGSLHANVLGMEVVTANGGTILNLLNTNRKDNTGYDLKHLFIGSEGTLGIITKVILSCPRLPASRNVAYLKFPSFEAVLDTMKLAKQELGETLSACELMDHNVLEFVEESLRSRNRRIPIQDDEDEGDCRFSMLVETLGSNKDHDEQKMDSFLEKAFEGGFILDGIVAQDGKQIEEIWGVREHCNPAVMSTGYTYKYDISVPLTDFYNICKEMDDHIQSAGHTETKTAMWGHLIDGNVHFNVVTPGEYEEDQSLRNTLEPKIFELVTQINGSISAEHGLGQCKHKYLPTIKSDTVIQSMYALKELYDPKGILNPGKYLPER